MRLLTRLLLYVLTPFLIGSITVLLFVGSSLERTLRADIANGATRALQIQIQAMENLMATHRHTVRLLSASSVLKRGEKSAVAAQLAEWEKQAPDIEGLYFARLTGTAYGASGADWNIADRDYYPRLRRGEPVVVSPIISRATGRPVVLIAEPVFADDGNLIGALCASIAIERLVQSVRALKPTTTAIAILSDAKGDILPGQAAADGAAAKETLGLTPGALRQAGQPLRLTSPVDGQQWQVFHDVIPTSGMHLALAYPEKEIYATVARAWQFGLWIMLALALAAVIAAAIFNRWLLRPIGRLAEAQARLGQGDLEARAGGGKTSDELGRLAESFDRMAAQLGQALTDARRAEQQFRALFENANDAIFILDGASFVTCNPFAETLFRCSREKIREAGPIALSPPTQADGRSSREAGQAYLDAALAGEPQRFYWQHMTADGEVFDAEVCLTRLDIAGKALLQSIVRDISDRNRALARESAMEKKFRRVFEASPDSMVISRLEDGLILEANEGFERLTGYRRSEAIGRTAADAAIWAYPEERHVLVARLRAEGTIQGFPAQLQRRDGNLRHVSLSAATFVHEGDACYVAIVRDITDERTVQRALMASEARLKTLFEAAPIPMAITRARDFTYVAVNPAHERVFGYPAEHLIGQTVREAGLVALSDNSLREQTKQLLAYGEIDNAYAAGIDAKGQRVHFMYSSRIVDLDGEPVIISMSTDISRLKEVEEGLRQTEEALRESEMRFISLFQSSPAALGVFHGGGGYEYPALQLNEAWFRTFRYPAEEVIGRSTLGFGLWVNAADRDVFLAQLESTGEVRDYERWLRRHDGEPLLCSIAGRRVVVGPHRLLIVSYIDITQQRKAEEALRDFNVTLEARIQERTHELQHTQAELMRSEKLAALGALVAGVAHELNTPIGTCLTVASTLCDHTTAISANFPQAVRRSELEGYLADAASGTAILMRNLQRAAELIQSFKSIAVDQASDQQRRFDLRQIVEETLVALRPSLKKKPFVFRVDIEAGLSMNSYPGPLEQVVVNLVNNAILHGLEDREQGEIAIRGVSLDAAWIRLTITDDGKGIAPTHLSRVFDPFFTTKLGKGGSGLGLHIVRNIVSEVLGGYIRAESELGRGTSMIIDLPRNAPALKTDAD